MDSYERFKSDFRKVCDKFSEKIAITFYKKNGEVEECSYAQMEQRVCEIVKTYQARGMQRGDRVAVLIPLCTNAYLDILALAYMGVTSVVLDINLHEKELMRILEDAHVSCILTVETLFQEKMSSVNVPVFETSDKCLCLKSLDIKHPSDPDYEAIAILYSSGTTSKAKGVVIGYEQEINAMTKDAADISKQLRKNGHEIVIVTGRAHTTEAGITGKLFRWMLMHWLKKNHFEYDDIFYCSESNSSDDKLRVCLEQSIDILIDDKPENLTALKNKLKIICYSSPCNQQFEELDSIRVDNMMQLLDKVSLIESGL